MIVLTLHVLCLLILTKPITESVRELYHHPPKERYILSVFSGIIGCYHVDDALFGPKDKNEYHFVNITWNRGTSVFTWKTKAGASWTLKPIFIDGKLDTTQLAVGHDCPYYKDGYKFAALEWEGLPGSSNITTINSHHNEMYQRYPSCSYNSKGMHFTLNTTA